MLLGPDGGPRRVRKTVHGRDRLVRITPDLRDSANDGGKALEECTLRCTTNHIVVVDEMPSVTRKEYLASEMLAMSDEELGRMRLVKPTDGIEYPEQPVPVSPWALGFLAADCKVMNSGDASNNEEIQDSMLQGIAVPFDMQRVYYGNPKYDLISDDSHGEVHTGKYISRCVNHEKRLATVEMPPSPPYSPSSREPTLPAVMASEVAPTPPISPVMRPSELEDPIEATADAVLSAAMVDGKDDKRWCFRAPRLDLMDDDLEELAGALLNSSPSHHCEGETSVPDGRRRRNELWTRLCEMELVQGPNKPSAENDLKHVPLCVLRNSRRVRMEYLAGFVDGNGYDFKENKTYQITQSFECQKLIDDLVVLIRSLGWWCSVRSTHGGKREIKGAERNVPGVAEISFRPVESVPCVLARKHSTARSDKVSPHFSIQRIELEKEESEWYGFKVDGDQCYLRDDFLILHNSGFEGEVTPECVR